MEMLTAAASRKMRSQTSMRQIRSSSAEVLDPSCLESSSWIVVSDSGPVPGKPDLLGSAGPLLNPSPAHPPSPSLSGTPALALPLTMMGGGWQTPPPPALSVPSLGSSLRFQPGQQGCKDIFPNRKSVRFTPTPMGNSGQTVYDKVNLLTIGAFQAKSR